MSIVQLEYTPTKPDVPQPINSLIDHAEELWNEFWAKKLNRRYPRYIASDPKQVYAALSYVRDEGLALGDQFIEWGSGFGVATCMAQMLGFEATGIEREDGLAAIARQLAKAHKVDTQFLTTSYIPEGYIEYDHIGGSDIVPDDSFGHRTGPARYADMDIGLDEIDVFFVYPWPGEQEMMLKLFSAIAGEDALLVAYLGDQEVCIYRKV